MLQLESTTFTLSLTFESLFFFPSSFSICFQVHSCIYNCMYLFTWAMISHCSSPQPVLIRRLCGLAFHGRVLSFLWTKEVISNSISTNSSLDSISLLSSTNYSLVPAPGLSFYPACSTSINLLSIQQAELCLQQYVRATASSLNTPRCSQSQCLLHINY